MSRPAPHRWILDDLGTIRFYRCCTGCHGWFEQTVENFTPRARDATGAVRQWHARCKPCLAVTRRAIYARKPETFAAYGRRNWEDIKQDPERLERRRESRRRSERAARSDPERAARRAKSAAAYRARLHADPERHAALLVNARMNYRLRQWKKGLEVGAGHSDADGAFEDTQRRGDNLLDPAPFVAALDRFMAAQVAERRGGGGRGGPRGKDGTSEVVHVAGYEDIAELAGVSARALHRYRSGESAHIALGIADRLAIALGLSLAELTGE